MIGLIVSVVMYMDIMIRMVVIDILINNDMGYADADNINTGDIMSDMDVIGIWMVMIIDMIVRSVSATWYRTNVRPPHFCQYAPTHSSITSHTIDISI